MTRKTIYVDGEMNYNKMSARLCYLIPDITIKIEDYDYENNKGLTHNDMEFLAVIKALTEIKDDYLYIATDSALVVNQFNGKWKINYPKFASYIDRIKQLIGKRDITINWVSRERNLAGRKLEMHK